MSTEFATKPIEPKSEFAGILKDQTPFEQPEQTVVARRVNGAFDRLMLQSGLSTSPSRWLLLVAFSGVVTGLVAYLLTHALLPIVVFAVIGGMIPVVLAAHLRDQRLGKLLEQLPDAIDRIGRLSQTGRNLEGAFRHAAADTHQPLGGELSRVCEALRVGVGVNEAMRDFALRTGIPGANMLAGVLGVHSETGGQLATPLFDLADDVREQIVQRERELSIAAEARWPATVVIALPFVISAIYLSSEPMVASTVMNSFVGRATVGLAVALWALGSILALRTVRQVTS